VPPAKGPASAAPEDLEAAAMDVLGDKPEEVEAKKEATAIKFECPMCFEPVELALDLGGKKHPCPHCKRIISVPMPKIEDRASWRDTGPKLPSAAKRDEGPALEGAWGSTQVKGATTEALKEAGVIKEKEKPLTAFQKLRPYLLAGSVVIVLMGGGFFLNAALERGKEKQLLAHALSYANAEGSRKEVGAEGLAALHAGAALYYARSELPRRGTLAGEQVGSAVALATSSRNPERDGLLLDLPAVILALGGSDQAATDGLRLKWDDAQKALLRTLSAITPAARLDGLRRVCAGLIEHDQTKRVLPLTTQLYGVPGPDRGEALGIAGLELARHGKKKEAEQALGLAESIYRKEQNRPSLRASVVALAIVLEHKPVPPGKGIDDEEAHYIGQALGESQRGNLKAARDAVAPIKSGDSRLRALVAVATGGDVRQADKDDFARAVEAIDRPTSQPWLVLRLIEAGAAAGVPSSTLEAAAGAIRGRLAAWAQLLLLRAHLSASRDVVPVELLDKLPPKSLASHVGRVELSAHNMRHNSAWAGTVKTWPDPAGAYGALGVALGMQKGK
jgi:hypothetical protein